jgi:hypothetical protein
MRLIHLSLAKLFVIALCDHPSRPSMNRHRDLSGVMPTILIEQ